MLAITMAALAIAATEPELVGGYVVGIIDDGGEAQIEAQGIANPEHGIEVSGGTVFHVASLSKQVTAAALAMAILDGEVALDDPLAKHIPEAAHYGEDLTLAHLVYFTSGLTEPYDLERENSAPWTTHYYFSVPEAIKTSLSVEELQFAPGSQWRYNNINYQLMAEVVARIYNRPFADVVRERVFEPLGMTSSFVNDDITEIVPNRANGVLPRTAEAAALLQSTGVVIDETGGPILIRRNAPHYGGSGVLTSMQDWLLWQQELLTRETFGDQFWDLMVRTQRFDHNKDNDAFGLVHAEIDRVPVLWFAGSDIDASTYMIASPERGISASCFSNQPGFDCGRKAEEAFRALLGN